jgi:RNA polymerase sigma-70 factor (ECF subfamily)
MDRAGQIGSSLKEPARGDALVPLVAALARSGQLDRAVAVTDSLLKPARDEATVEVVGALASAGDIDQAESMAVALAEPFRSDALIRVAVASLAVGEVDRAEAIAWSLDDPFRDEALAGLVAGLITRGRLDRAELLATELGRPARDQALLRVITALADADKLTRAEMLCHQLSLPVRDEAMVRVCAGLAESGRMSAAQGLVAAIFTPRERERAASLIAAQAALDRARDSLVPADQSVSWSAGRDQLSHIASLAAAGDRQALQALLTLVRQIAQRYVKARLWIHSNSTDLIDDVTQEICMTVLGALSSFQGDAVSFESFVYGIAARKVADAQRSFAIAELATPNVPDIVDNTPTPEHQAVTSAEVAEVMAEIDKLPEVLREILRLRVVAGLSAEETGRALDMTPGAVRVAQHRALNVLRGKVGHLRLGP